MARATGDGPGRLPPHALVLVLLVLLVPAAAAEDDPLEAALAWLAEEPAPAPALVEAVAGAGIDPAAWPHPGDGVLERLHVPADRSALETVRAVHAVAASGHDPRSFQGPDDAAPRDLLAEVETHIEAAVASATVADAAFAILALVHGGTDPAGPAVATLAAAVQDTQREDGGWRCVGASSVDCTGFALAALAAAHAGPHDRDAALGFLAMMRTPDGGIGSDPERLPEANTNSAAWALHAYRALGQEPPQGLWDWIQERRTPEGGFAWRDVADGPDRMATIDLLPHLAGNPLPWPRFAPAEVRVMVTPETGDGQAIVRLLGEGFTHVSWTDEDGRDFHGEGAVVPVAPGETRRLHVHAQGEGVHHRALVVLEHPVPDAMPTPAVPLLAPLLALVALAYVCGASRVRTSTR